MSKFFVVLFCVSAGCFVWTTEASPFFFNVQKSYVTQPRQTTSQTTVSQNADFGLSGLVSKWLALSQIFTDKLIGKTAQRPRPRPTQRPVVAVDSQYVAEKLSTTTTRSPAEEIDSSTIRTESTTDRDTTTRTTRGPATTERATTSDSFTTPDRFTITEGTTEGSSTSSFATEGTSTTTKDDADTDKDTDTDPDADGSENDGATASTTDRTTSSQGYEYTTKSTTSWTTPYTSTDRSTNGYEYTTQSTTISTSSSGYDLTAPYTEPSPTSDRTTTPHGYEYQTPPTPYTSADRTTTPREYEYIAPSTDIRPTTYRPRLFNTEPGKDNEIPTTDDEDNANDISSNGGDFVPPQTNSAQIFSRFSSAFDGGASANAITAGRVSAGGLSANSIFKGTVSAGGVSIGEASAAVSKSENESPFDILSVNERVDSNDGRKFQGILGEVVDETTGGIDPRVYYIF